MKFKTFGDSNLPKIIILHGGGLSWWSVMPLVNILQDKYCIITPIIDGHGESYDTTFISISDSADKLIAYIDQNFNGHIYALCGLSIGAQIIVDVLSKRDDICKFSIIESALIKPLKFLKNFMLAMVSVSYPLTKYKWFAKIQAKSLFVSQNNFNQYFEESSKLSKTSLLNITLSNSSFILNSNIKNTKAKILILVGEKELKIMKKSAIELHKTIINSSLLIVPKSGHGELSLLRPQEYCQLLFNLIKS